MRPRRKPRPTAKVKIKVSLTDKSAMARESDLKPNQTMAQSLMKKIGRKAKNKTPRAALKPGRTVIRLVKKTYLAQNKDVPGNPIVIRTARTDKIHIKGADKAMPPM
jgi:hypothetical protein